MPKIFARTAQNGRVVDICFAPLNDAISPSTIFAEKALFTLVVEPADMLKAFRIRLSFPTAENEPVAVVNDPDATAVNLVSPNGGLLGHSPASESRAWSQKMENAIKALSTQDLVLPDNFTGPSASENLDDIGQDIHFPSTSSRKTHALSPTPISSGADRLTTNNLMAHVCATKSTPTKRRCLQELDELPASQSDEQELN
ncbi:hypothetical protein V5O48_014323, partial [Marasmius crinis-equi]